VAGLVVEFYWSCYGSTCGRLLK